MDTLKTLPTYFEGRLEFTGPGFLTKESRIRGLFARTICPKNVLKYSNGLDS